MKYAKMAGMKFSGSPAGLWILCLAGGLVTLWLLWQSVLAVRSGNWPTTPGVVIESDASGYKRVEAYVSFRYLVDGVEYTGDRIRFGDRVMSKEAMLAVRTKYKKAAAVTVSYNPARPAVSVLEPGIHAGNFLYLLTVLAAAGAGVYVLRPRQARS